MELLIMTKSKPKQKTCIDEEDWPRPADDSPEMMEWAIWNQWPKDKNGKRIIL